MKYALPTEMKNISSKYLITKKRLSSLWKIGCMVSLLTHVFVSSFQRYDLLIYTCTYFLVNAVYFLH